MQPVPYKRRVPAREPAGEHRKGPSYALREVLQEGYSPVVEGTEKTEQHPQQHDRPVMPERKGVVGPDIKDGAEAENVGGDKVARCGRRHRGQQHLSREVPVKLFEAEYSTRKRRAECSRKTGSGYAGQQQPLLGKRGAPCPRKALSRHGPYLNARALAPKREPAAYGEGAPRHLAQRHPQPVHILTTAQLSLDLRYARARDVRFGNQQRSDRSSDSDQDKSTYDSLPCSAARIRYQQAPQMVCARQHEPEQRNQGAGDQSYHRALRDQLVSETFLLHLHSHVVI